MKIIYIYLVVVNVMALLMYGIDKYKAIHHKYRISEASLLLISLFGGSLGALIGMYGFHHKTKKPKFFILVPLMFVIEVALYLYFYIFGGKI